MTSRLALLTVSSIVVGGLLAGCSSEDSADADSSASLTLCRTAAVADATLTGTRSQLSQGNITGQVALAYNNAVELLTGPATDADVSPRLAELAVAVVTALDLTRATLVQVDAQGIDTTKLSEAAVREVGAFDDLAQACADELPEPTQTE